MLLTHQATNITSCESHFESFAAPQTMHIFSTAECALPFGDASLDALFLADSSQGYPNEQLCHEFHRVLKTDGIILTASKSWLDCLQKGGFHLFDRDDYVSRLRLNWRGVYVGGQNGRIQLTELQKPHVFPLKSPFFETAVCLAKR